LYCFFLLYVSVVLISSTGKLSLTVGTSVISTIVISGIATGTTIGFISFIVGTGGHALDFVFITLGLIYRSLGFFLNIINKRSKYLRY
jgi:hypothetical protein